MPDETVDNEQAEQPAEPAGEARPAKPAAEKPAAKADEKAVARARADGMMPAAAGTHAVVIARPAPVGPALPRISRRRVMLIGWWSAVGAMLLGIVATILNSLYPRGITGFGGKIFVGTVEQLEPGKKLHNLEAKAWVVRLDAEQARRNNAPEGAILALYHKCPHLGCTVPYRPDFSREDPRNGETYAGWFLCPCHGSTYSDAGVRVFGPAPRSMDTFTLIIDGSNMTVDTGKIKLGTTENAQQAILPG